VSDQPWISELFATIDNMDADKFASFVTEDAIFRYASNPPTVGKAQIREGVSQFFSMFQSIRHTIKGTWSHPDTVFVEGDVHYTRQDGSLVTLPFLNCFKMKSDKIHEYLIYIDPAPLRQ
jgi:ketosteroid isomerase-like protein